MVGRSGGAPSNPHSWAIARGAEFTSLVILFGAASVWRFWPWLPRVFAGDDLINYSYFLNGRFAGDAWQCLTGEHAGRFRPLFASVLGLEFHFFGDKIRHYLLANLALNVASAMVLHKILRFYDCPRLVAALCALAVCTTRFSIYQITQVTGLVEGLGFLIFLAVVLFAARSWRLALERNQRSLLFSFLALICAFLLVHTHERYVAILPWLGLVLWTPTYRWRPRVAVGLGLLCISILLFNVWVKRQLGTTFFTGTGGSSLNLNVVSAIAHYREAIRSILQFNLGPSHLVGLTLSPEKDRVPWNLARVFEGLFLIVTAVSLWTGRKDLKNLGQILDRLRAPLLIFLLLLPPSLSSRLEQRWLVEPFAFLFVWGAIQVKDFIPAWRKYGYACLGLLPLLSISVDSYIARSFPLLSNLSTPTFANSIKTKILDLRPRLTNIVLLAEAQDCGWGLANDEFVKMYGSGEAQSIRCVRTFDEINFARDVRIFRVGSNGLVLDLTYAFERFVQYRGREKFDLIAQGPSAVIQTLFDRSVERLVTATGPQNVLMGEPGASFRFDRISIEKGTRMAFGTAMITDSRAAVTIEVTGHDGRPRQIFGRPVEPRLDPSFLISSHDEIDLSQFSGQTVSLIFRIKSEDRDRPQSIAITEAKLLSIR